MYYKMAVLTLFLVSRFFICTAQTVGTGDTNALSQRTLPDTAYSDSLTQKNELPDTTTPPKTMRISPNAVTAIVDYFAQDSVSFDIKNKKSTLFNQTNLLYEDVELKSDLVTIDFAKNELHAEGVPDSNAVLQGKPVFKQGSYEFKSYELDYNFATKKGLIKNVITQEGEGYLHGELVKKNADNSTFIHNGKYTTCNLEHPHFEIDFRKAKVIPNDKIITGPLYMRIASIPTFIALPFGFFPNSNKRTNGLIMPAFVTDTRFGYCLAGLGYYFAVKDRVDFQILTDVFMSTAFGVGLKSNYIRRYKGNGNIDMKYNYRFDGDLPLFIYNKDSQLVENNRTFHDLHIVWHHTQDRKSHPVNNFSANVDFQTSGFRDNSATMSFDDRIKSVTSSTVNFSTSFKGRYMLGINANIQQNLSTGDLGLDLPQIRFDIQPFFPLRKKKRAGKLRWYEEISMQYNANMRNGLHTYDSILFKQPLIALRTFNSELTQNLPIKNTIRLFKHLSWGNTVNLGEVWQMRKYDNSWERDSVKYKGDSVIYYGQVRTDTAYAFKAIHQVSYRTDLSVNLFGMYMMKKGRVYAFRHSFTPQINFTYTPAINNRLNRTYFDSARGKEVKYSSVTASYQQKTSASIGLDLSNRLEMKVRKKAKEGEEEEFKKVTILDNFTIGTFYDFMRDSLRLDPIRISGMTLLFRHINLNFSFAFDPYAYDDSLGVRTNTTELEKNHRLLRLSSTAWRVSFDLNLNRDFFKSKKKEKKEENTANGFKDWSITLRYSFDYNMTDNEAYYRYHLRRPDTLMLKYNHRFNNTINISGRFFITSKWSLEVFSGYDFQKKAIAQSSFKIRRDLHCWVMEFEWEPIGPNHRFSFIINAKASMLNSLKLPQRKTFDSHFD